MQFYSLNIITDVQLQVLKKLQYDLMFISSKTKGNFYMYLKRITSKNLVQKLQLTVVLDSYANGKH